MGCGLTFEHNGYALDETVIKTDGVLQCTLSGSLCWNGNCISIPWPWVRLVVDIKSSYWQWCTPHSSSHTPFLHNLTIIRTEFKCWAEYIFILQMHNWNETQLCLLLCYLHVVSLAIARYGYYSLVWLDWHMWKSLSSNSLTGNLRDPIFTYLSARHQVSLVFMLQTRPALVCASLQRTTAIPDPLDLSRRVS